MRSATSAEPSLPAARRRCRVSREPIDRVAQGSARGAELIRLGMQPPHCGDELDGLVDERLGFAGVRERVSDARRRELVPDWNGDDGRPDLVGDRARTTGSRFRAPNVASSIVSPSRSASAATREGALSPIAP